MRGEERKDGKQDQNTGNGCADRLFLTQLPPRMKMMQRGGQLEEGAKKTQQLYWSISAILSCHREEASTYNNRRCVRVLGRAGHIGQGDMHQWRALLKDGKWCAKGDGGELEAGAAVCRTERQNILCVQTGLLGSVHRLLAGIQKEGGCALSDTMERLWEEPTGMIPLPPSERKRKRWAGRTMKNE